MALQHLLQLLVRAASTVRGSGMIQVAREFPAAGAVVGPVLCAPVRCTSTSPRRTSPGTAAPAQCLCRENHNDRRIENGSLSLNPAVLRLVLLDMIATLGRFNVVVV